MGKPSWTEKQEARIDVSDLLFSSSLHRYHRARFGEVALSFDWIVMGVPFCVHVIASR